MHNSIVAREGRPLVSGGYDCLILYSDRKLHIDGLYYLRINNMTLISFSAAQSQGEMIHSVSLSNPMMPFSRDFDIPSGVIAASTRLVDIAV